MSTAIAHTASGAAPRVAPEAGCDSARRRRVRHNARSMASRVTHITDAALMSDLAAGNVASLDEIYARYSRLAYSLAMSVTRDARLAEEALQETFVRVWISASSFAPGRGSVRHWIAMLAHSCTIDVVRRERNQHTIDTEPERLFEAIVADDDTELAALLSVETAEVQRALEELPFEQRESLELAYFGGYTQSEIAERQGVPLGTVKTRMFHALRKMRELLAPGDLGEVTP